MGAHDKPLEPGFPGLRTAEGPVQFKDHGAKHPSGGDLSFGLPPLSQTARPRVGAGRADVSRPGMKEGCSGENVLERER